MTTDTQNPQGGPIAAAGDPLAGLALEAQAIESNANAPVNAAVQAVEAQQAAQTADEARAIAGLALTMGLPLLAAWKPHYAAVYGTAQQAAIADSFAALAQAQGWQLGDAMGRYGPWLAFAASVAGPLLPVVMAEIAQAKKPAAPTKPDGQAPSQPFPVLDDDAQPVNSQALAGQRVMPELEGQRVL